ncbi:MAG TPA: CoA transferase [Candidatus Aveggerthella excrementigallinarum]|nr:CoA transferase [Candidatus Aveggerthella excrementigallinarum]
MWPKSDELPQFGVLQGVKVLHATQAQASPFAAGLLADYGADVIWLESALTPDVRRSMPSRTVEGDSRNQRNFALNIPSEEGRKIFLSLIEDADIFIECSRGAQYEKWGLSDEVLWEHNPKLVIMHQSGFGKTGVDAYVNRPSYDSIAQAYSSYMDNNRNPVTAPYPVGPYAGDFITGMYVALGCLAALHRATVSGQGESMDLAQFEACFRTQQYETDWLTDHVIKERAGDPPAMAGITTARCKDGRYIQTSFTGAVSTKKGCELLGIPYGTDLVPEGTGLLYMGSEAGDLFRAKIEEFCAEHDGEDVQRAFFEAGLPCQLVYTMGDLENDPHAQARGLFVKWQNMRGEEITGSRGVPVFKRNPTQVWRGAPWWGYDNEDILHQFGYDDEQIKKMYEDKVIAKDAEGSLQYPWPR